MNTSTSSINAFDPTTPALKKYLRLLNNPIAMRIYYFFRLPTILYWGVGIKKISIDRTELTLPYSRRTKNPFKSIYFAAQCGTAELSTGLLCNIALKDRGRISMLIIHQEAEYIKKAASKTTFVCEDGAKIRAAVQEAIDTGKGVALSVSSVGRDATGDVVSRFTFTWSFKVKK